jgi:hypothetical protein
MQSASFHTISIALPINSDAIMHNKNAYQFNHKPLRLPTPNPMTYTPMPQLDDSDNKHPHNYLYIFLK